MYLRFHMEDSALNFMVHYQLYDMHAHCKYKIYIKNLFVFRSNAQRNKSAINSPNPFTYIFIYIICTAAEQNVHLMAAKSTGI